MAHRTLPQFVASTLLDRASFLALRWLDRAQAATPRHPLPADRPVRDGEDHAAAPNAEPDVQHAERILRALADEVTASTAAAALLTATPSPAADPSDTARDARPSAEVIQLGWQAGARAFDAGLSVHHVVRDAHLLLAVVLADLERETEALPADVAATPADAFAAARRLQRGMGRYTEAAASGFVHALLRTLRERYRLLRHDLRNPLGTIQSALSFMEDESVPEAMRHGPNIRSMVARNAGSLDRLIANGLDDAAAASLLTPPQDIPLRDVALAARRDVRDAARLAGCEVVIGDVPATPPSHVDAAALELTLTALFLAALANAGPGDAVHVDCTDQGTTRSTGTLEADDGRPCTVLRVTIVPNPERASASHWDQDGLALASALATDHGGGIGLDAVTPAPADFADLSAVPAVYLRLPMADLLDGSTDGANGRPGPALAVDPTGNGA